MKSFRREIISLFLAGSVLGAMPNYAAERDKKGKQYAEIDHKKVTPRRTLSAPANVNVYGILRTSGERFYCPEMIAVDCGDESSRSERSNGSYSCPPFENTDGTYSTDLAELDLQCRYRQGGNYSISVDLKKNGRVIKKIPVGSVIIGSAIGQAE